MLNLLLCCPIHLLTNGMICFLKTLQKVTRLSGKLETKRMILKRNMSQSWRKQLKAPKMLSGTGLIFKKNQGSSCEAQKWLATFASQPVLNLIKFCDFCLKGLKQTQASFEIAHQWQEGSGNWFAHWVQVLAQHYQTFEELPVEKCGGQANAQSLLYNEAVKKWTRDWWTSQSIGQITPWQLHDALNSTILPDLGVALTLGLSERTAWWWLIKLGWCWTVVR